MGGNVADDGLAWAERFGFGRLLWLTHEAVVGADVGAERIVLWNPSAERIFGYTVDEAVGMPLDRLVPEDLVEAHHRGIERFRDLGDPQLVGGPPVEVRAIRKDGESLWVALTLTSVADDRQYVAAVIRDITAQRAADVDRHRAHEALRSFLAAASHDLRSPLVTISGFADLLADADANISDDERADMARRIRGASEHAWRLVDDLLTMSEIQAGVVEVRPTSVDVAGVVRQAMVTAGVEADVDDHGGATVRADLHHLQRMLVNLLANAAKHGEPPVSVAAIDDAHDVVIRVCDRGTGIADNAADDLFDAFTRGATARGRGSGLGLSIVRGLAESNGGSAWYERRDDVSCFVVRLPSARRPER